MTYLNDPPRASGLTGDRLRDGLAAVQQAAHAAVARGDFPDAEAAMRGMVESFGQRHDSDCQTHQHTYQAGPASVPGYFPHGPASPSGTRYYGDLVGDNHRRLLLRWQADGVYIGGALVRDYRVLQALAAQLTTWASLVNLPTTRTRPAANPKPCCEDHDEVAEDVQCCHDCPDEGAS